MTRALQDFLDSLMTVETGVDLSLASWYAEHLDDELMRSWRVDAPGHICRDPDTGHAIRECVSVREYFRRYGVEDVEGDLRNGSLWRSRYCVVNAWGFVGYQIGEAILIEAGYYDPPRLTFVEADGEAYRLRSFYTGDLDAEAWRHGVRAVRHRPYGRDEEILATDVNRWHGKFTGKDGVTSLAALKTPEIQETVFRNLLGRNLARIRTRVTMAGLSFAEAIRLRSDAFGVTFSTSGCLAAAHLCGADGVADFLLDGRNATDETGTSLADYFRLFSGYRISNHELGLSE